MPRQDARYERSRAALHRAVLEFARERSIDAATVSEIAAIAGVNRSTFYQHADSPSLLLRDALRAELDDVRHRLLDAVRSYADVGPVSRTVAQAVLEHIRDHAPIYRRSFEASADPSGLSLMLTDHFERSSRALVEQAAVDLPAPEAHHAGIALRYVAGGAVGAIQAWLRTGMAESPAEFARLLVQMQPPWWIAPSPAP